MHVPADIPCCCSRLLSLLADSKQQQLHSQLHQVEQQLAQQLQEVQQQVAHKRVSCACFWQDTPRPTSKYNIWPFIEHMLSPRTC